MAIDHSIKPMNFLRPHKFPAIIGAIMSVSLPMFRVQVTGPKSKCTNVRFGIM
ncbi:unnamed protein product, partial [Prunus brigantina]